MSLETLLRLSVLRAELLSLARELAPEERRIVAYSAGVLRLLNRDVVPGDDKRQENKPAQHDR